MGKRFPKLAVAKPLTRAERLRHAIRLRTAIYDAKNRPCADCGNLYIQTSGTRMTFDHLDRSKKMFDIGSVGVNDQGELGRRLIDFKTLRAEIAKTEVVCRRCHTLRERKRDDGAKVFAQVGAVLSAIGIGIGKSEHKERSEAERLRKIEGSESFEAMWKCGVQWQCQKLGRAIEGAFVLPPNRPTNPTSRLTQGDCKLLAWCIRPVIELSVLPDQEIQK